MTQSLTKVSVHTPTAPARTNGALVDAVSDKLLENPVGAWIWRNFLTFICLILPVGLMYLFAYGIASDRYVSEAKFIVRSASSPMPGGFSNLLSTFGVSAGQDATYSVHEYIKSRDAVAALRERLPLEEIYSRPEADRLTRYPGLFGSRSDEALYKYYNGYIEVFDDRVTSITTLTVQAYRPEDAQAITQALLEMSEDLVNNINERSRRDATEFAQEEVERAKERVVQAQFEVDNYRNQKFLFDPEGDAQINLGVIAALAEELAVARVRYDTVSASSPNSPALIAVQADIDATEREIANVRSLVVGDDESAVNRLAEYERLVLKREFADQSLLAAMTSYDYARQEYNKQKLYIETIVQPNLPDKSTQPKRSRLVMTALLFGMLVFVTSWLVIAGAREHGNKEI